MRYGGDRLELKADGDPYKCENGEDEPAFVHGSTSTTSITCQRSSGAGTKSAMSCMDGRRMLTRRIAIPENTTILPVRNGGMATLVTGVGQSCEIRARLRYEPSRHALITIQEMQQRGIEQGG